jgi:hypothetical protein
VDLYSLALGLLLLLENSKNSKEANGCHNVYFKKLHSYEILGAGMLWKPKEAQILTNFIDQPVNIQ